MDRPVVLKGKEFDALLNVLNPIREEQIEMCRGQGDDTPTAYYCSVCTSLEEHMVSVSDSQGIFRADTEQSYGESWIFGDSYRVLEPYGDYYIVLHVTTEQHLFSHPDEQGIFRSSGIGRLRSWLEVLTDSPYKTNEYVVVYRMFVSGVNVRPDEQGIFRSEGWLKYDNKPIFADDICPLMTEDAQ